MDLHQSGAFTDEQMQKYQIHPDCKTLICFVYDPEGIINNPRRIEKDLSKEFNGLPVLVFITPH